MVKRSTHNQVSAKLKNRRPTATPASERRNSKPHVPPSTFPIVGVGASAGGLEAFTRLLKHLPLDTGLGFVLVQHLDPQHESALTEILKRATSMPVCEVTKDDLRVKANHVYVISPNTNLAIAKGVLKLKLRPEHRGAHHPIDAFFESLAQDQRESAIGVVLSGTATDGTLGLETIKAEGGITFAQDNSAKYDSMPRSAVAAGCVDFVLSPEKIAKELARIAKHPYVANGFNQASPAFHSEAERERAQLEGPDAPLPSGGHGRPRTGAKQARAEAAAPDRRPYEPAGFKKILLLLRNHCGVDFSLYKSSTIRRRITRRMVLNKHATVEAYAQFLRGNTGELNALYSDCLISVTSFFRNPETFDLLERKIFPRLLRQRQRGDEPLRVWVVGCSTGQEAYSIAMTFHEATQNLPRAHNLQVFATDLNDALLDKARHGLYAKNLALDISPERLRRFFVEEQAGYRVIKPLRDMVVFARQNLIADPPFSRMDLISCRNLLIYLDSGLQKKALATFHYALKPEGFLFLGASESISGLADLFQAADRKHKIYSRKRAGTPALHLPLRKEPGEAVRLVPAARSRIAAGPLALPSGRPEDLRGELNAQREADRLMLNQFAPPGVLVNADLQILQFRGPTGAWLEPPSGKATFNVLKMAREGLMLPLRAAINRAKKENKTVRRENVRVHQNGRDRTLNLEVVPLKNLRERCFLILFEDRQESSQKETKETKNASKATPPSLPSAQSSRRNAELERDLAETREYLQSLQEQHEASTEELQAANEEVQSANEELQSINEELETAKEELESSNEELTTVNEEMANRNAELNRLTSDLLNLQTSTTLGIILLGRDLTIRRFSVPAEKQFNLMPSDLGQPIRSIRHNFIFPDQGAHPGPLPSDAIGRNIPRRRPGRELPASLSAGGVSPSPGGEGRGGQRPFQPSDNLEALLREVISEVRERQCEARGKDGRWYSLRARPYFTLDNRVDGAVLVVVDITDLKRTEREIKAARDYAEATIRTARDPLLVLGADLRVERANDAFYKTFEVKPNETEGILIYELGGGPWNVPELRQLLENIIPQKSVFNDFAVTFDFAHIGRRTMLLNARRLDSASGEPERILLGIQDVTERRKAEKALGESEERYRTLFDLGPIAVYSIDASGVINDFNRRAAELWGREPASGDTDERFCGSFKMFRPDGSFMPHNQCPMAEVVSGKVPAVQDAEVLIERPDGSRIAVLVNIQPLKNDRGEFIGAINCFYDITHRKAAEDALRSAQAQLADRAVQLEQLVAERTARLQDTIGELEHFSYTITHDMRAPLRAMQGFAGILLDHSAERPTPRTADFLRRIMGAASRMDALIRDSLQYAKVVREHAPLAPVEPLTVLRGILESYPSFQPPHVEIQIVEPLPPVIATAPGLAQCFSNLLANGIKFVKSGETPRVRIRAELRPDRSPSSADSTLDPRSSTVRFWFEDNGIGIPQQYHDRIFGMFQQLDKSYEGTGIGLALVRKTVERMKGKAGVESVPGEGSRFWLELKKAD